VISLFINRRRQLMGNKQKTKHGWTKWAAAVSALMALNTGAALADGSVQTEAPVFWTYDFANPVGNSQLIRTPEGVTGVLQTTGLPAGHAVTLWFVFFNAPEQCATRPCQASDMAIADGDFHFAAGQVTGSGKVTFAGHLQANDISGSGILETGMGPGTALTNPYGAEIVLALHSHGPKMRGLRLKDQISSYLGGCELPFLGDDIGFATGPQDIPTAFGECSTIQVSVHAP
jgi:hypothetical protein